MHSPTTTSGPTTEPAQVMRQPARARIELAVAQPLVLEHHRVRLGRARNLRREQLGQCRTRHRPRGRVPLPQDGLTLLSAQNVEPADQLVWLCKRAPKVSGIVVEALRACRRCFWPELQSRLAQLAREVSPVPGSRLLTPTCRLNPISQLAGGFAGSSRPRPACSRSVGRSGERSRPPMLR